MKRLVLLVGPSGSGKTTLAKIFESDGYVWVSQDNDDKEHLDVFDSAVLAGKDVVVDRLNFARYQRSRYLDIAKQMDYDTEIIVLHESYETCLRRCIERKDDFHPLQDEQNARAALSMFFSKYEEVEDSEADVIRRIGISNE